MASGADEGGDDFVVGRTNKSEERMLLVAINGDPDGYQTDFVLDVSIEGGRVLTKSPSGVDAVHATGTVSLPSGGAIGTIPEGNGVVARGLNGVAGYVHAAPRDTSSERDVHAGVLGVGGSLSPGVFGRGVNGVMGYEQGVARDVAWEAADTSGVCGNANGIGVRGKGSNGGVAGESYASAGVQGTSQFAPGVRGASDSGIGVLGTSLMGDGVTGTSERGRGGVFQSRSAAQVWLVPRDIGPVNSLFPVTAMAINVEDRGPALPANARGGELTATKDGSGVCSLWFCLEDGPPARWAQVLLGPVFEGNA